MGQVLQVAAAVTVMLTALGLVLAALRWLWIGAQKMVRLADDLLGEPAQGLQPERPGIVKRLSTIEEVMAQRLDAIDERQARIEDVQRIIQERLTLVEAQLKPNGGGSLRDTIDRTADRVDKLQPVQEAA